MDSRARSIAKALSWRLVALLITAGVAYFLTGEAMFALSVGLADSLVKIFAYYLHERAWVGVRFGRAEDPPALTREGVGEAAAS